MSRAIRSHLRDFVAILCMALVAAGVAGYILSNQRFEAPAWVPLIGTDFYELEAELSTGQAVVPGQGQTVNVAGVKVGDIGEVRLEQGRAVVRMKIEPEHAPVYRDATILLRPKTGLKDMFLELDPGTRAAGPLQEGGRIAVSSTLPDVNPDEILAQLDTDARTYLRVLLNAGAEGLADDSPAALRESLKRLEPTARDGRRVTALLAERRRNLARVVHNFQALSTELGAKDRQLSQLVDAANANFEAIASQDRRLREALRLLPGTLDQTRTALAGVDEVSRPLGPALAKLRPGARALAPSLRAVRPFVRVTTPAIRDQIRPFARDVRPTVRDAGRAATDLAVVAPRLTRSLGVLNSLLDTLAYNPPGPEEGYLFWASWLNHATSSLFSLQDAHGPVRRGLLLVSCPALNTLNLAVRPNNPQLDALSEVVNLPDERKVCPDNPGVAPAAEQAPRAADAGQAGHAPEGAR